MSPARFVESVVEPRRKRSALDENISSFEIPFVGQIDFSFGSSPIVLLIQASGHLTREAVDFSVCLFQISEHLLVRVFSPIAYGHTSELIIDGGEHDAVHVRICKARRSVPILEAIIADPDSGVRYRKLGLIER